MGFVDVLAVHPDHQRRGLGSTLLRNSFAGFAAAGLKEAQLGVASDNPRALALYERVGMHARFQTDVYERRSPEPAAFTPPSDPGRHDPPPRTSPSVKSRSSKPSSVVAASQRAVRANGAGARR